MVGHRRLENIQDLVVRAIRDDLPGDFVECAFNKIVWRRGASMYATAVIDAYAARSRQVHLVGSLNGLPRRTTARDSDVWSQMDYLKVSKLLHLLFGT